MNYVVPTEVVAAVLQAENQITAIVALLSLSVFAVATANIRVKRNAAVKEVTQANEVVQEAIVGSTALGLPSEEVMGATRYGCGLLVGFVLGLLAATIQLTIALEFVGVAKRIGLEAKEDLNQA